jgi:hypothetical protein
MKRLEDLKRRRALRAVEERCIVEEGDIRARPEGQETECHSQWCRIHGTDNRRAYRQTHPRRKRKRDLVAVGATAENQ